MLERLLQSIVVALAQATIRKYRPRCIGVTGSVGKSSTKTAIALVLKTRYRVGADDKSYNTPIGLPLAVLGERAQGRNIIGWSGVLWRALMRIMKADPHYPHVLVLELGVDKPGDMAFLMSIVRMQVGVVTAVSETHLEQLGSIEHVLNEKMTLPRSLWGEHRFAVLNADDPLIMSTANTVNVPVITYGLSEAADLRIQKLVFARRFDPDAHMPLGVGVTITYRGDAAMLAISHIIGIHQLMPILAALAVGVEEGIALADGVKSITAYEVPKGRMRLLRGIKGTLIIDDSYNSSPLAARAAIETLANIDIRAGARRIAVLGDMRELGEMSEEAHRELGRFVAEKGIDMLLTVGIWGSTLQEAAERGGMDKSQIFCFNDAHAAGLKAQELSRRGDVILVKGSQNTIRLERAVKEIMAEPEQAEELLVRQGKEWEGK